MYVRRYGAEVYLLRLGTGLFSGRWWSEMCVWRWEEVSHVRGDGEVEGDGSMGA
jgi:hypothetical protein